MRLGLYGWALFGAVVSVKQSVVSVNQCQVDSQGIYTGIMLSFLGIAKVTSNHDDEEFIS